MLAPTNHRREVVAERLGKWHTKYGDVAKICPIRKPARQRHIARLLSRRLASAAGAPAARQPCQLFG